MIKKLTEANITKYYFLEAYDGQNNQIIESFNKIKQKKNIPIVSSGHFACLLSHIKAIKLAIKYNYEHIMILEDDVFFCDNFINKLNDLMVPEFDIMYLGGITSKKKFFSPHWAFSNGNKIMGAYGYILNKKMFNDIISGLEKLEQYVDIYYIKSIQPFHKTLILNDYIKTDLTSTDTSHKSNKMIKRLSYIK
jgi:GR25 family glycosyltransferase involved in LPS biosynthesis